MFANCTSLSNVEIPSGVLSIGSNYFAGCSDLMYINIPTSVINIGTSAFEDCSNLVNITLPENLSNISENAFYNCINLTSVVIPQNATNIGLNAFYGCNKLVEVYNLSSLNIEMGSNNNGQVASFAKIINYSANDESIVKNVDDFLFVSVNNVNYMISYIGTDTNIELPQYYNDDVYVVDNYAFYYKNFTTVTIPNTISSIGYSSFYGCENLSTIKLPFAGMTIDGSANTHFGYIFGMENYSSENTIPSSLRNVELTNIDSINDYTFANCYNISSVILPKNVTSIGASAFMGCTGLTSITLPEEFTSIGANSFYRTDLSSIIIPNKVTTIGNYAFAENSKLENVTLSEELILIGAYTFENCISIRSILLPSKLETIDGGAFYGCIYLVEVYNLSKVTLTLGSTYEGGITYYAKVIHTSKDDPSSITNIDDFLFVTDSNNKKYLFNYIGNKTTIEIPSFNDEEYTITDYAFYNSKLVNVTISENVTSIGAYAFGNCTALSVITYNGTSKQWDELIKDSCWNTGAGLYEIKYKEESNK